MVTSVPSTPAHRSADASSGDLVDRYDLADDVARTLAEFGFDADRFDALRTLLNAPEASNYVAGELEPLGAVDLTVAPPELSDAHARQQRRGDAAIADGRVAVVLLAGGMATRFGGGVKALAEVLPGLRFLDVKVMDLQRQAERIGAAIPLVLMSSFQSHRPLNEAARDLSSDLVPIHVIPQSVAMRLRPDGGLYRDQAGQPSLYAPGHGDLPDTLRRSGFLADFVASGGTTIFMTNVDNAAATLDPVGIGVHLTAGLPLTAEVTPSDAPGGAPYRVDGDIQIVEDFRVPPEFDRSLSTTVSTNSLTIEASAIVEPVDLTWFRVNKEVDGDRVVQFERLVGELSAFVATNMTLVDADGPLGRFQPVKTPAELDERRPMIRAILEHRGVI